MEKRKAGSYTQAVHESQIKSILSVIATKKKIPVGMLRELVRPLFPPGHSLDAQTLFNFRLKINRLLKNGSINIHRHTFTGEDERMLVSPCSLEMQQSPEFLTEALALSRELLEDALKDRNDTHQVLTYLSSLANTDDTFSFRVGESPDGESSAFVWQTGVMRKDFQLFGDVLFLD